MKKDHHKKWSKDLQEVVEEKKSKKWYVGMNAKDSSSKGTFPRKITFKARGTYNL